MEYILPLYALADYIYPNATLRDIWKPHKITRTLLGHLYISDNPMRTGDKY